VSQISGLIFQTRAASVSVTSLPVDNLTTSSLSVTNIQVHILTTSSFSQCNQSPDWYFNHEQLQSV